MPGGRSSQGRMVADHETVAEQRTVGQLLRAYRVAAGLTQGLLAERAGVGEQTIGYLERDLVLRPQRPTMRRLAVALDLSAEQQEALERARRRQPPRGGRQLEPTAAIDRRAAPIVDLFVPPVGSARAAHLVTLTGPPQETTAVALAARMLFHLRGYDNVYLLSLVENDTAARLPTTILATIAPKSEPVADTPALLDSLRAQHLLLIVDRCEHLIDPCAALIDAILQHCPAICVLATSTEPLHVEGEIVRPIAPRP